MANVTSPGFGNMLRRVGITPSRVMGVGSTLLAGLLTTACFSPYHINPPENALVPKDKGGGMDVYPTNTPGTPSGALLGTSTTTNSHSSVCNIDDKNKIGADEEGCIKRLKAYVESKGQIGLTGVSTFDSIADKALRLAAVAAFLKAAIDIGNGALKQEGDVISSTSVREGDVINQADIKAPSSVIFGGVKNVIKGPLLRTAMGSTALSPKAPIDPRTPTPAERNVVILTQWMNEKEKQTGGQGNKGKGQRQGSVMPKGRENLRRKAMYPELVPGGRKAA